ncbi:hypothetical protein [Agromyces neolithicus]
MNTALPTMPGAIDTGIIGGVPLALLAPQWSSGFSLGCPDPA